MAAVQVGARTVSELFDEGFVIFNGLSKNYEPTNSLTIQCLIRKCISLFEESTKLVSISGMFSSNENIDEVGTTEVKFFLLPALLGTLTLKLCMSDRLELITTAEIYFVDFLERCRNYGIIDYEIPCFQMPTTFNRITIDVNSSAPPYNMAVMACNRNKKIQRFLEEKNILLRINDLQRLMKDSDVEDETKRSYYIMWIKYFCSQALEELDCLYSEKGYILTRPKEEEAGCSHQERQQRPRTPLCAVVITAGKKANNDVR